MHAMKGNGENLKFADSIERVCFCVNKILIRDAIHSQRSFTNI